MNNLIIIFGKELLVDAFVVVDKGEVAVEFHCMENRESLENFIAFARKSPLSLIKEISNQDRTEFTMAAQEIPKDHSDYPKAVLQELKRRGFVAVAAPVSFKEVLILLNDNKTSLSERQEIVISLLKCDPEEAEKIALIANQVMAASKAIKANREEWEQLLRDKKQELLKRFKKGTI